MGAAHEPPRPPRRPTTPATATATSSLCAPLEPWCVTRCDAMRCDGRWVMGDGRWDGTNGTTHRARDGRRRRATTTDATATAIARVVIQRGSRGWRARDVRARGRRVRAECDDDGSRGAMGIFPMDRGRARSGAGDVARVRVRVRVRDARAMDGDGDRRSSGARDVDRGARGGTRAWVVIGRMKWIEFWVVARANARRRR